VKRSSAGWYHCAGVAVSGGGGEKNRGAIISPASQKRENENNRGGAENGVKTNARLSLEAAKTAKRQLASAGGGAAASVSMRNQSWPAILINAARLVVIVAVSRRNSEENQKHQWLAHLCNVYSEKWRLSKSANGAMQQHQQSVSIAKAASWRNHERKTSARRKHRNGGCMAHKRRGKAAAAAK